MEIHLIGSVGIALAFVGTVLGYFDFVALSGRAENALNWPVLLASAPRAAPRSDAACVRLHPGWLWDESGHRADAHLEARRLRRIALAACRLMSSSFLRSRCMRSLRWKVVVDAALGPGFTNQSASCAGAMLSLLIAAFSLVLAAQLQAHAGVFQHRAHRADMYRPGLGPLGVFAALLHLVNHTAAKSMMFFLVRRSAAPYTARR